MKQIQDWRGTVTAIASTTALCFLGLLEHPVAHSHQENPRSVNGASSSTIPFDPPVVHPGYSPQMKAFKKQPLRGSITKLRDLTFHEEDRKVFKALHPFLLHEPKILSAQQQPIVRRSK